MEIDTDPFYKNEFIQIVMRQANAKMLRGQLTRKFGRVPKCVDERLKEATTGNIENWSMKILTADSIEGVLGKD